MESLSLRRIEKQLEGMTQAEVLDLAARLIAIAQEQAAQKARRREASLNAKLYFRS